MATAINTTYSAEQTEARININWLGWFICGIGAMFYFYEYLLRVSPSVMTKDLMFTYHINATGLGNLSACYYYIYAPLQLPVGVLMDRYGPRLLLTGACLMCAFGTYLFASTHFLGVAELGRFLVGFGSAFAFVGVLKLATIWLPPKRFAIVSGLTMALGMIGGLTGENLLTSLVAKVGWRYASFYSAAFGVALTALMVLFLKDGFKCGTAAKNDKQLPDMKSAFTGLFSIIKNKQMWVNGLIGGLLYLPTSAFAEMWGPSFLMRAYEYTEKQAAATVSMVFLGWAIGGFMVGWISNRIKQRRLPLTIGSMVSAVLLALVFYLPGFSPMTLGFIFLVFGIFSSAQVLVFTIGHEISCSKSAGTAIALTNMFVMMGGALFQPVIGMLLDLFWTGGFENGVHVYSTSNYQMALSVLPLGLLLSVVMTYFLRESYGTATESATN